MGTAALALLAGGAAACSGAHGAHSEQAAQSTVSQEAESSPEVLVYKSPTCGCCSLWAAHLEENGFTVVTKDLADLTEIKQEAGVPADLFSCHTALVDGYVVEGHVPADVIRKLLEERPDVVGLAVAGMPIGSPGMEQGSRKDPYDVLTFDREGKTSVFARR
jgi:hypothetical protein